jgi:hypothetical protein
MKKTALFIVIIAFVFLNSCKTNDDYLPNDDVITQNSTTVNQFEITTLTAQNIEFASTEYTASFNNTQVTLNVSGDILVFQVPDVPAGNYSLSASIEGENYIFSYAVNALPTITDPDAYIKEHVTDGFFRPGQIDTIVALTANMYDPQSNYANGQILKTYRTNYLNQLAQTSTADKISFAKLVAANPTFFDALEDLTSYVDSFNVARFDVTATVSPEERLAEIKAGVNSRVLKLLAQATIFAYINTLTIAEPGVNIIVGISTAGILLHRVWLLNNFLMMNLDKSLIEFGDLAITSTSQKSQSTYTFDKDHPYSLFIKANYRNLNQQDVSSSSPTISAIVTNLNKFEELWNKVLTLVPDDFVGNSFHIKHVSATKTKNMYVNGDYLTIEVIGNNAVNVEPSGTDQLIATFSTNATTDQPFSFKIQYDFDGISNGANTYDATLIVNQALNVSAIREGKTIAATATGGTAPYQYKFFNKTVQAFSQNNTFDLVYNGNYGVIVQDANGLTDTAEYCVDDVTNITLNVVPSDNTPGVAATGFLYFSYSSSLGLIPESLLRNNSGDYQLPLYITSTNLSNYNANFSDLCNPIGGVALNSYTVMGDQFNRTIKFGISNNTQPLGSAFMSIRLNMDCTGENVCPSNPNFTQLLSQEYNLNW